MNGPSFKPNVVTITQFYSFKLTKRVRKAHSKKEITDNRAKRRGERRDETDNKRGTREAKENRPRRGNGIPIQKTLSYNYGTDRPELVPGHSSLLVDSTITSFGGVPVQVALVVGCIRRWKAVSQSVESWLMGARVER